jgi:hypothetical protein
LDDMDEWKCPSCSGAVLDPAMIRVEEFHNQFDCGSDESSDADDDESTTPSAEQRELWPPFGLLGTERSLNAIGQVACDIPALFEIQGAEANPPHDSPSAQLPPPAAPCHTYPPPQPYASLNPGAPPAFANASTPPRVSASASGPGGGFHHLPSTPTHPVVFGSPGVTVLSPGAGAGAGATGAHAHHTVYAAGAVGASSAPFANLGHYPHASHSLFHFGHVAPPFPVAFMAGYAGSAAPAFADAAAPMPAAHDRPPLVSQPSVSASAAANTATNAPSTIATESAAPPAPDQQA